VGQGLCALREWSDRLVQVQVIKCSKLDLKGRAGHVIYSGKGSGR
jgi:hypothetical protein